MEQWKEYKIGDIALVKGGKRLPKGINLSSIPNSHPYIRVRDLGNSKYLELNSSYEYVDDETQHTISRYIVNTGDIIISIVGTIGLVGIIGASLDNANLTENCVKLINIEEIDREYLYYYLISQYGKSEISKGTVGAVQAKLPIKNIQDIRIQAPCLSEQKDISTFLKSLDDKIELNRRINDNLEQQAQALFKSWFVDFEPFKDGEFVDSELGMIPKGWRVGRLSDISEITMGQSPSGDSYNKNGIGEIFYQGRTEFGDRFPSIRLYTTAPNRMAEKNSILLSVRAPVGDINVALHKCCIGRGLASINAIDKYYSFLLYTVKSMKKDFDVYNGEGTVFGSINKDSLISMRVIIPTDDIKSIFENIVSKLDNEYRLNHNEIVNLSNLRDSLLPRLMSGELKINDLNC